MKRLPFAILLTISVAGLIASTGCGNSEFSTAQGIVTLDGTPLGDAMVIFIAPGKPLATARTNEDGEFQMETGSVEGVKPGEYIVTVTAYQKSKTNGKPMPKLATPERYSKAESSELKVTIGTGNNDDISLPLQSL
jgi:hypothetical protein